MKEHTDLKIPGATDLALYLPQTYFVEGVYNSAKFLWLQCTQLHTISKTYEMKKNII